MPRKSLEDRVLIPRDGRGTRGHPAPRGLSPPARALWRGIVASRPVDHFDPGSLVLLRSYCEVACLQDGLFARRLALEAAGEDALAAAAAMDRRLATGVKMLATLAAKLRLSVQSKIRSDSGKVDERGGGPHRLLGGNVTTFRRATKPTPGDEV